jgi:hypothetical protein
LTCCKTTCWSNTHNRIRDSITRFIKSNQLFVQHEFCVAAPNSPNPRGKKIIADHLIIINDQTLWLDNSTIVPTGATYRRIAAGDRRAALRIRSREKHKRYDSHAAAQKALFFALILDSGGAINHEWHLLLKTLLRLTDPLQHATLHSSFRDLIASVSSLAAKGNANSISRSLLAYTKQQAERNRAEIMAR